MSKITIRAATATDAGLIYGFITELADYEKAADSVVTSPDEIAETLFAPDGPARAFIAEYMNQPAGYMVYFYNYSTWLGQKGIYLEDIYVTPACRGKGIGKALLKRLAGIAVRENCGRFEWSVLDWNEPALEFYRAIGAEALEEWTTYRLSGGALERFAGD